LQGVDTQARAGVDFSDSMQRDAYYDRLLALPDMAERVDPGSNPGQGTGRLLPSCTWSDTQGQVATARPPRRIVSLAKAIGQNSTIQSICQNDLTPAIDPIVDGIAAQLGTQCLNEPLSRNSRGLLDCEVIWELSNAGDSPTYCAEQPFLSPVSGGRAVKNSSGGENCLVQQLDDTDPTSATPTWNEGWYYDDFSADIARSCRDGALQRIAFTTGATPPLGVRVVLDCHAP
ncbi:MAG TPA: hypothetical protein VHZ95_03535, partial [Polyangiales bacterium]|nr:hypothetical protein [Polyangiales bacterium]